MFKKAWAFIKRHYRDALLWLLTAVVGGTTGKELVTPTPEIMPDSFEAAPLPENRDHKGFYLVDILYEKEVIDEEAGQPERTYTDQTITISNRLWLSQFPTLKEVQEASGGKKFGFDVKSFLITRELIKPRKPIAPEEIKVEQPDEKEKEEAEVEK